MPFITGIYNNAGPNFIDKGIEGYKTGLNMKAMSEEREFRKKKMLIDEETSKFNKYKSQLSLGSRLLNNVVDQASYTQAIKDDQKMGTNVFRDAGQIYDPAYIAKKKNAALSMSERLAVGNQKISALKAGLMMGQEGEYIRDPQYQDPNQLGSLLKRAQLSELLAKPQIRESLRQTKTIQRDEDLARQSGIRKEKFYSEEQKEKIAQRLKGFVPAGRDKASGRLNYKRMKGWGSRGKKEVKYKESQYKAGGFAKRAIQGDDILNNLISSGFDPSSAGTFAQESLPDFLEGTKSDEVKTYMQSKNNFISAVLRKESGAAISDQEYERENKKYFPQWGDEQGVLRSKKQARHQAIENLRAEAGGAFDKIKTIERQKTSKKPSWAK